MIQEAPAPGGPVAQPSSAPDPCLLASIREVLGRWPGLSAAVLFGSAGRGTARPESDVDLAVEAHPGLTPAERLELVEQLAAATGRPIDLVDLETVGEPLLGQILTTGVRLLGSPEAFAALIIRHLREQADFLPYRRRILAARRLRWTGT
ncbi:MAG: nucleotidyltransferase domain-containing protein [Candidatus Sericytochromatia bacterium]|nr:nucleotidyltransferase domain-containing protein [Candidatus Sericytochromatia bacterium]